MSEIASGVQKKQGQALGIHQYASAAGMSCAMVVYMEAVGFNSVRISAPSTCTRLPDASLSSLQTPRFLLRRIAARSIDTTTIISNKEAEA
mgnify:CR=1 FL=1